MATSKKQSKDKLPTAMSKDRENKFVAAMQQQWKTRGKNTTPKKKK